MSAPAVTMGFMVNRVLLEQALKLSPAERVELADALLVSVGDGPLSPEQEALLTARIAEADANPGAGKPAGEVVAELRARYL